MNLLKKIFGGNDGGASAGVLEETMQTVIEKAGLDLSFDVKVSSEDNEILVDVFGQDEELLKDKDGALLDAFQLFLKRVLQNKVSEEKVNLIVDSGTFREDADQSLIDLAEKLKGIALKKKKAVYFRALPPRERKIVHQHLADDKRVKSKSVGDGLFKKIKVFPAGMKSKKSGGGNNNQNKGNSNHQPAPSEANGNVHTPPPSDDMPEQNFNR